MNRISIRRALLAGGALVAVAAAGVWISIRPSNDRAWSVDQSRLPSAMIDGSTAHVRNVRDFRYASATQFTPAWSDRTYDLDKLESVWFILVPFSREWRGPAHTFVSFGFSDSQYVAISVEARREQGETYSVARGLLKRYEVMYVIGDERDLIARRAVHEGDPTYVFPVTASRERMRQMFVEMLERATTLAVHPEFYNTATNNCTSNLVEHVNRVAPGRIPATWKTVVPGYSDDVASSLGLIDSTTSLDRVRQRYLVNERARAFADSASFSLRIRGFGLDTGGAAGRAL